MNGRYIGLCCFLLGTFVSCSNNSPLEQALTSADSNRPELEAVLNHYKHDSLKYRAVCFLIENMPGKYGIEAENPDDAYKRFLKNIPEKDSINWKLDSCHVGHLLDSVSMVAAPRMRKVEDIRTMTSSLLIENIDYAFKAWEESGYSYGFEDFCHYILPYRIGHEPLSSWRSDAYRRYIHLLDSGYTPREVAVSMAMNKGMRYNIGMVNTLTSRVMKKCRQPVGEYVRRWLLTLHSPCVRWAFLPR